MRTTLRALRSLALALWLGGLAFFAVAVAPAAFRVLPTAHEAGLVVSSTLRVLHWIGLIAAPPIVLSTFALRPKQPRQTRNARRLDFAAILLTLMMFAATAFSQFDLLPAMEHDRQQAGGVIDQADPTNPARQSFDRLHHLSEQVEGGVLICGIALLVVFAAEPQASRDLEPGPLHPAGRP